MSFPERKKQIIEAVNDFGSLSVFELSDKLNMSPATIRRDLHDICNEGLLLRTHGGAMKAENPVLTGFTAKSGVRDEQKDKIGKLAADLISEGDTIFMDCGSTVFKMCRHIRKMNIRVVTNSLPIVAELFDAPSVQINLIGGELDKGRRAVHGSKAIQHIESYHVAKAFIGVDGISPENGLSAHSEHESSITSAFMKNASQVYLLCDSTKIGKDSYLRFAPLSDVACLVTDEDLSVEMQKKLSAAGLKNIEKA